MSERIITLPIEPPVGTTVEIVDGSNKGNRYRRIGDTWEVQRGRGGKWESGDTWSSIWWAVCEDGAGGTSVRVLEPDPHPVPWSSVGSDVRDRTGRLVCEVSDDETAQQIVRAVNRAGSDR